MRRLLLACVLALGLPLSAQAQTAPVTANPIQSAPFSFTAINQSLTLPLNGQSTCAVTVTSIGGGATLIPEGSSDNGNTYTPIASINSGTITGTGIFIGLVAPYALTNFQLLMTNYVSGTIAGTVTCSPAVSFNSSGFVQLSPSTQQTGNINVSGNATLGGTLTFGSHSAVLSQGSLVSGSSNSLALNSGDGTSPVYINLSNSDTAGLKVQNGGSYNIGIYPSSTTPSIVPNQNGTNYPGIYFGTGAPSFSAPNASIFLRYDGGANLHLYINTSGASSSGTTWTAVTD